MGEFGEFLGWVTAVFFGVAVLNFFVKRINKMYISKLPKESSVKKYYIMLMKIIVKYHRWFGMGAGAIVLIHMPVQIFGEYASVTGIAAAVLLVLTALLGIIMHFGHKPNLVKVHRVVCALAVIALIVHLLFH